MGKVDFIEIDTLANYIGKGGKIIVYEFDIQMRYTYLPIELIKSNGDKEDIRCSAKLTELIQNNIDIVKYLPYFIVIETTLKRKSISINRVSEEKHNISDYVLEFHPIAEAGEILRNQKAKFIEQKEEKENQDRKEKSPDEIINEYIKQQLERINKLEKLFSRGGGGQDAELDFYSENGGREPRTVAMISIRRKMEELDHPKIDERYAVYNLVSDLRDNTITEQQFNEGIYNLFMQGKELKDFFLNDFTDRARNEQQRRVIENKRKAEEIKRYQFETKRKERQDKQGYIAFFIIIVVILFAYILSKTL